MMPETTGNRVLRWMLLGAAVGAMLTAPHSASAHSRSHVFKPGGELARGAAETTNGSAPEIDPSALGNAAALIAGGLAVLAGRRRSRL